MSQGTQQSQAAAPAMAAPQPKVQRAERAVEKDVAVEQSDASAAFPRLGDPILRLQRAIGNQAVGRLVEPTGARYRIQPKLHINAPNDVYEQEADRVADAVMRDAPSEHAAHAGHGAHGAGESGAAEPAPLQAALVQRASSPAARSAVQTPCPLCEEEEKKAVRRKPMPHTGAVVLQRKCAECEKKELQRKAIGGGAIMRAPFVPEIQRDTVDDETAGLTTIAIAESEETTVAPKRHDASEMGDTSSLESGLATSRGGGSSLPHETRSFFEDRMGADFSGVRIHDNAPAADMARSINARAFTHGSDVYFGAGQYAPTTDDGRRLLAHELTHTMQQGGALGRVQREGPKPGAGGTATTPPPAKKYVHYDIPVSSRDYNNAGHFLVTVVQEIFKLNEMEAAAYLQLHGLEWEDKTFKGPASTETTHPVGFPASLIAAKQAEIDALQKKPGGIVQQAWDAKQKKGAGATPGGPEPGWDTRKMEFVPGQGVVQVEKGTELRAEAKTAGGPVLPFSTTVIVVKEEGEYYFVGLDDGRLGYVLKKHIDMRMPEPKARLHMIKSGETATHIVKKYYGNFNTWGADQRLYVNVLLYVNKMAGRDDGIKGYDYQSAYTYANKAIWIPSQEFALYLRDRKDISSGSLSYDVYQTFLDVVVGPPVFLAGLIHGALESLWDALVGIVQLAGMAWDLLKAIFTGTIGSKASELWKSIESLDVAKLIEHGIDVLDQNWNNPSLLKRWHYRGWLVGYIVMEIITLFFTDGLIEGVKVVANSAKVAKFIEAVPILKEAVDLAKALKTEGKAAKLLDALKADKTIAAGLEKLNALRNWVKNVLQFPIEVITDLAADAIERLQKLGYWFQERLRALAKSDLKLLRECLGCLSPCKVDPQKVMEFLQKLSKEGKIGKRLMTVEDVLAALPAAFKADKIGLKLMQEDSALLALIKEAELTDKDLGMLAELVPAGKTLGEGASYRTFTAYLTKVVPAKTGPDIDRFNKIIDAMMLADVRQGSALKGSMFETFNKMHVKGFEGLETQVPLKVPKDPARTLEVREADFFDKANGGVWDTKHSPRPDLDQFKDYTLMVGTTQNGVKIESINYLFAKKEWAEAWVKAHQELAKAKGVKIFYLGAESTEIGASTKLLPIPLPP